MKWIHWIGACLLLQGTAAWGQPAFDPKDAIAILRGVSPAPPASSEAGLRQVLQHLQGRGAELPATSSALPALRLVLAANLQAQARHREAEVFARQALLGPLDPGMRTIAESQLGDILVAQGRIAEAQEVLRTSLGADAATAAPTGRNALLLAALARTHIAAGDDPAAEALLRRALPLLQDLATYSDPETRRAEIDFFRLLVRKGTTTSEVYPLGLGMIRLTVPPEQLSTPLDVEHMEAAADFAEASGSRPSEALRRRVLEHRGRQLDPAHPLVARASQDLARNLLLQGKDREAEVLARHALALQESRVPAAHRETAVALDLLARIFRVQGREQEAEALWRRGLELSAAAALSQRVPLLVGLGEHLAAGGRAEEAVPLIKEALGLLPTMPRSPAATEAYLALVEMELRAGRCPDPQFLQLFQKLDSLPAFFTASHLEPRFRQDTARMLACEGRFKEASQAFTRAFSSLLGRVMATDSGETQMLSARAAIALSGSRETLGEASRWVLQAAGFARHWRQGAGNASRYRATAEVFHAQLEVAWQQSTLGDPLFAGVQRSEGFMAAQDLEVSSTARALAQTAARLASGSEALSALVRRQQDLSAGAEASDREAIAASARGDPAVAAGARARLLQLNAQLAQVDTELERGFPRYRDLVQPKAVSTLDLQKRLRPGEGVLLLVPAGNDVHVFAVSQTQVAWHRARAAAQPTRRKIDQLRCQLDPMNCGGQGAQGARGAQRVVPEGEAAAATGAFDRAVAHELYRELLAPVEPALAGVQRLYVTAMGALGTLPLGLLPTDPRASQWLADKYVLVSLPSVSSLRAFGTASAPSHEAGRPALVGFADPVLAGRAATARGGPEPVRRFQPAEGGGGRADPALLRTLQPLPGTRRELAAMAQLFPATDVVVRLGAEATEQALKAEKAVGLADVLVFATHGLLPRELGGLEEPGLVFTPPASASALDDGVLTASEVAQLFLRAQWVILSACNTAASDSSVGGESLSGLSRAFLYAGARAVLASHWRVQDDVTAALTVETLRARRDNPGLGRAEALHRAMRAVRTGTGVDGQRIAEWKPAWALPAAWAPFVVVEAE